MTELCAAKTKRGQPCQSRPQRGEKYCGPHLTQQKAQPGHEARDRLRWEAERDAAFAAARRDFRKLMQFYKDYYNVSEDDTLEVLWHASVINSGDIDWAARKAAEAQAKGG